ncbi:hypothetical protein [Sphingopyxis sp. USTB-05]|uniref:hypothetical protein n=1 Tax=Sphingopyxis sp. USTB-05 TaxID=2830667 RepID=UPI002078D13E|nr:hypothetical protein [Sphingopyxis sp. USTB-05]USI79085.1 hypothetical protein KEC45_09435 [Sphingopyxis sp. USTB-05]
MSWFRNDDIYVSPQALIDFAWSGPMRDLAKRVGISDVALKKMLHAKGIGTPPQGHWNRVHAGKSVAGPPGAPSRRPGQTGRIRMDHRFKDIIAAAPPMPASGPFASTAVAENLEELRAVELKAIGRVSVPRSLDRRHPGLVHLLKREDMLREKAAKDRSHWRVPEFDTPLDQRKLRFLNGLFFVLSGRNHSGVASNNDRGLGAVAHIGDMNLSLEMTIVGKHRTELISGYRRPARDLPASTPLQLAINWPTQLGAKAAWQDGESGNLESRLAEIAADIIVAGEAAFRRSLVEEIERQEAARQREIESQRRRLEQLEAQRVEHLEKCGEMLARAVRIRSLIDHVKLAAAQGRANVLPEELDAWQAWASAHADTLDPLLSGHMFENIQAPK